MATSEYIETVIVGGGQAGLATSYHLALLGREHVVLESADRPARAWREQRWDSFRLNTPNWAFRMPGAEYSGDSPDGFLARDEVVDAMDDYVARYRLPVRYGVRVTSIDPDAAGTGFTVRADATTIRARHVVVATGLYQRPRRHASADEIGPGIVQLDCTTYRSPDRLPSGAVLVVGSAQSGCQIAEELYQSGRTTYLCVGAAGRVPRRYRGRDIFQWLGLAGYFDRTADMLPSPKARFAANPQVSGVRGGHTINLHRFARDGVVLLGHMRDASEHGIQLAPDLRASLAAGDEMEAGVLGAIDAFVEASGIDAPSEDVPVLRDGYDAPEITEIDFVRAGITSIVWAAGFSFDFTLVRAPVFDADGFPIQVRGVTDVPGLYFVGLPWLHTQKSGLLLGVGEDAEHLAGVIAAA